MRKIKVICDHCKKEYKVPRDIEIKSNIQYITFNFCPDCEDEMDDYYEETHHKYKKSIPKTPKEQFTLF